MGIILHVMDGTIFLQYKRRFIMNFMLSSFPWLALNNELLILHTTELLRFNLVEFMENVSWLNFAWHIGLYTKYETCSPNFLLFLQSCVQEFTTETIDVEFWRTIAKYIYCSWDS